MPTYTLEIEGVERNVQLGSFNLRRPASGIHSFVCDIASADGSYRPSVEEDVAIYEDDGSSPVTQLFGGLILKTRERAQETTGAAILTEIQASDYSILAQRTVITEATLAAGTLKSQLQTLVTNYLSTQGITLHASQVDGPSLEAVVFDGQTGSDVLSALALSAEMVWRIDHDKVLRVFVPGTETAPFDLTESNRSEQSVVGDLTVERSHADGYATRIIVKFGTGTALQTETFTGDGTTTSWTTDIAADPSHEVGVITRIIDIVSSSVADPTVITTSQAHGFNPTGDRARIKDHAGSTPTIDPTVDRPITALTPTTFSIKVNVTVGGTGGTVRDTVPLGPYRPDLGEDSPFKFQWDPITHTVYQRPGDDPIPSGTRLELTYNAQYPATEIVTGSPPGTIDKVIEAPEAFTRDAARAIGEAELARSSSDLIRVEYRTQGGIGLAPGQVQSITESYRNLNHSCLITEIASRDISANLLEHTVQLIANDLFVPSWRKVYEDWLGGGSGAGGGTATTVTTIPQAPLQTGEVLVSMVEIPHADILTLHDDPVAIVSSPGAGFALVPVFFQYSEDFALSYTIGSPATDTDLEIQLRYGDADGPLVATASRQSPTGTFILRPVVESDLDLANVENLPLVVVGPDGLTGGHTINVLRASVAYYIVPVADNEFAGVTQVFSGRTVISVTTSTVYSNPLMFTTWDTTEFRGTGLCRVAGTFRNLKVKLFSAPGSGNGHTFTLLKNGVATGITVTLTEADTDGSETSTDVLVAVGDTISLRRELTGGNVAVPDGSSFTLEFQNAGGNASQYGFTTTTTTNTLSATYYGVFQSNSAGNVTASASKQNVVSAPGELTGYALTLDAAPGGGTSYAYVIYKNGVAQNGSGGTPDTRITISGTNTTGSATFTLDLAAGDLVYLEQTPTGGPSSHRLRAGFAFTADEIGASNLCGGSSDTLHNTNAEFNALVDGSVAWSGTENAREIIGGVTPYTLKDLQVVLTAAPTAGTSYTLSVRKNQASPAGTPSVTVADANTSGSDSGDVDVTTADELAMQCVPSGTPSAAAAIWGLTQLVE